MKFQKHRPCICSPGWKFTVAPGRGSKLLAQAQKAALWFGLSLSVWPHLMPLCAPHLEQFREWFNGSTGNGFAGLCPAAHPGFSALAAPLLVFRCFPRLPVQLLFTLPASASCLPGCFSFPYSLPIPGRGGSAHFFSSWLFSFVGNLRVWRMIWETR